MPARSQKIAIEIKSKRLYKFTLLKNFKETGTKQKIKQKKAILYFSKEKYYIAKWNN